MQLQYFPRRGGAKLGTAAVDFEVMPVCDAGLKMPKHMRIGSRTRGQLSVQQETDPVRKRTVLVARILPLAGERAIPALYDAVLLSVWGDAFVISGFERYVTKGELYERSYAQAWHLEPKAVQDLIDIEQKWGRAEGEAHRLRELLERVAGQQRKDG